jgi:hypothetical protein
MNQTLTGGIPMPFPYEGMRYSNQIMVSGRFLRHFGWGGQYAIANAGTSIISVLFRVIETQHAINRD